MSRAAYNRLPTVPCSHSVSNLQNYRPGIAWQPLFWLRPITWAAKEGLPSRECWLGTYSSITYTAGEPFYSRYAQSCQIWRRAEVANIADIRPTHTFFTTEDTEDTEGKRIHGQSWRSLSAPYLLCPARGVIRAPLSRADSRQNAYNGRVETLKLAQEERDYGRKVA